VCLPRKVCDVFADTTKHWASAISIPVPDESLNGSLIWELKFPRMESMRVLLRGRLPALKTLLRWSTGDKQISGRPKSRPAIQFPTVYKRYGKAIELERDGAKLPGQTRCTNWPVPAGQSHGVFRCKETLSWSRDGFATVTLSNRIFSILPGSSAHHFHRARLQPHRARHSGNLTNAIRLVRS
jgi:hypothetical protein